MPEAHKNAANQRKKAARKGSNSSRQSNRSTRSERSVRFKRSGGRNSARSGRRRSSSAGPRPRQPRRQNAFQQTKQKVVKELLAVQQRQAASPAAQAVAMALALPHSTTAYRVSTEYDPEPTAICTPYGVVQVDFKLNDTNSVHDPPHPEDGGTYAPLLPRGSFTAAISNSLAHQCVTWDPTLANHKLVACFAVGPGSAGGVFESGFDMHPVEGFPCTLPFAYLSAGSEAFGGSGSWVPGMSMSTTWNLDPVYWKEVPSCPYIENDQNPTPAKLTGIHDGLLISACQKDHRYVYIQGTEEHPAMVNAMFTTQAPPGKNPNFHDMRRLNKQRQPEDGPNEFTVILRGYRAIAPDREVPLPLPGKNNVSFVTAGQYANCEQGGYGSGSVTDMSKFFRWEIFSETALPSTGFQRSTGNSPTPGVCYCPWTGNPTAQQMSYWRAGETHLFIGEPGWYRFDYTLTGNFPEAYEFDGTNYISIELSVQEGEFHMGYALSGADGWYGPTQGPVRGFHSIHSVPGWASHTPLSTKMKADSTSILVSPTAVELNRGGMLAACQFSNTFSLSAGLYLTYDQIAQRDSRAVMMPAEKGFYAFLKPTEDEIGQWMATCTNDGNPESEHDNMKWARGNLCAGPLEANDWTASYLNPPVYPSSGWLVVAIAAPPPPFVVGNPPQYAGATFALAVSSQVEYTARDPWASLAMPVGRNVALQALRLLREMPQYHENPLHFTDIVHWLRAAAGKTWAAAPSLIAAATTMAPQFAPQLAILGAGVKAMQSMQGRHH